MTSLFRAGLLLAATGLVWMWWPSQEADYAFAPRVERPAFAAVWPTLVIDEGHYNVHTAAGRFAPFAALLARDGFRVLRGEGRITSEGLRHVDVFVTANPLGLVGSMQHLANLVRLERWLHLDADAFAEDEVAALEAWVRQGGGALIAADHAPAGAAARRLAAAFGVEMTTWWAEDPRHADVASGNPATLVFSIENGLLADHAITRGRSDAERLRTVMTFTGQALRPGNAEVLLRLADTAREYPYRLSREREGRSAGGLAQAVAVRHGRGRVVVIGEAAALTAQLLDASDQVPLRIGMNRAGTDNAQFVLNVMRWLMGAID